MERFVRESHRIVPHPRSIQIRVATRADDVDNVTIRRRTWHDHVLDDWKACIDICVWGSKYRDDCRRLWRSGV